MARRPVSFGQDASASGAPAEPGTESTRKEKASVLRTANAPSALLASVGRPFICRVFSTPGKYAMHMRLRRFSRLEDACFFLPGTFSTRFNPFFCRLFSTPSIAQNTKSASGALASGRRLLFPAGYFQYPAEPRDKLHTSNPLLPTLCPLPSTLCPLLPALCPLLCLPFSLAGEIIARRATTSISRRTRT